ncbi:MAG: hypothetical protein R2754_13110 [Microthrixaceae bacterium]
MLHLRVVLALVALVFLGSSCGKVAEQATEKLAEKACESGQTGEDCDVDISEDGATVKVGDEEISAGDNTDYPEGYPDYLRLEGAKPISAVSAGDGSINVTLTGDTPGTEMLKTLQSQAEGAGCTADDATATAGGSIVSMNCADSTVTMLGIGDSGPQMGATITITPA